MNRPDAWDVLTLATKSGWVDPGYTEPLDDTVKRAQTYLDALKAEASQPGDAAPEGAPGG